MARSTRLQLSVLLAVFVAGTAMASSKAPELITTFDEWVRTCHGAQSHYIVLVDSNNQHKDTACSSALVGSSGHNVGYVMTLTPLHRQLHLGNSRWTLHVDQSLRYVRSTSAARPLTL